MDGGGRSFARGSVNFPRSRSPTARDLGSPSSAACYVSVFRGTGSSAKDSGIVIFSSPKTDIALLGHLDSFAKHAARPALSYAWDYTASITSCFPIFFDLGQALDVSSSSGFSFSDSNVPCSGMRCRDPCPGKGEKPCPRSEWCRLRPGSIYPTSVKVSSEDISMPLRKHPML